MPRLDKVSHPNIPEEYHVVLKDSSAFRNEEGKTIYTSTNIAAVLARYRQAKTHFASQPNILVEMADRFNNPMWENEMEEMARGA